jgi:hypothetical protein
VSDVPDTHDYEVEYARLTGARRTAADARKYLREALDLVGSATNQRNDQRDRIRFAGRASHLVRVAESLLADLEREV